MTLPENLEDAIRSCLKTWDLETDGELSSVKEQDGYETEVPFKGELLVEEALHDGHGNLLYNKEAEILLKGIRDGNLLLIIKEN